MAILSPLYNLPNHALEKQKYYQNSTKPIMYRGARGPLYVNTYKALFVLGVVGSVYGFGSLILGNKKE
ncbi:hypothetical protein BDN70DRAFT_881706 [Pholiota conissans]|uniref:Uncharacterized protein n=1 Tax=Pholiota conissans TaxID=109636 RepID=A0A9P6CRG4_9AGAR|nr:hypothetical protein BDN70DRAFT_881706 [Pholiota conissans]